MREIPLVTIIGTEGLVVRPDFPALVDGHYVTVRAVLERTCVCEYQDGSKVLVAKARVLADPEEVSLVTPTRKLSRGLGYRVTDQESAQRGRNAARDKREKGKERI